MKHPHLLQAIFILSLLSGCGTPRQAPLATPTGMTFKNTVVSLTFDDGDADNYDVRPILAETGLRATFYIVSGFTGESGYMTEDQIRGLYQDGHEIGGHTLNHISLSDVKGVDLKREICQDRLNLLAYGFKVTSFAYPYGYADVLAKQAVADCGYNSARIVRDGPESIPPGDPFTLQPMPYIVQDTDLAKMLRYVKSVESEGGGWAIFVFHHVCNDCDRYAVDLETFTKFAGWLARERDNNGLVIKTVDDVIGGEMQPGVRP